MAVVWGFWGVCVCWWRGWEDLLYKDQDLKVGLGRAGESCCEGDGVPLKFKFHASWTDI